MIETIIYLIFFTYLYRNLKDYFIKGIVFFFIINSLFTICNYIFNIELSLYYIIQSIVLIYILLCKLYSNIEDDKLNKSNVFLIFYKPAKAKQFLLSIIGLSYSSSGLLIWNKKDKCFYIYQMRYEFNTLQKIKLKDIDYLKKYLIIKTDIKIKDLSVNFENELLKQKARQSRTAYLRFNCLRSLRSVLDLSRNFRYNGEILPCIYLLILKIKNARNND